MPGTSSSSTTSCATESTETVARAALESLEPERERLERIVARRGLSTKTVRFLAAKGFAPDHLEDLVAEIESRALG